MDNVTFKSHEAFAKPLLGLDSVSSSDFLKNMNSALLYKLQTLLIMSTFDLLSSAVTLMARFSLTPNSYLQLL